jgi:hypothetical protein
MPRTKLSQLHIKHLLHVLSGSWFRNWFLYRDRYWLTKEKALQILKYETHQDFGYDVKAWRKWFDDNTDFEFQDHCVPVGALSLAGRNEMQSWDEVSNLYKRLADNRGSLSDLGKGMLDAIRLLQSDPDIVSLRPGYTMFALLIIMPDYDKQIVCIQWVAHNTFRVVLTPADIDESTAMTTFSLSEVTLKVKEYLHKLKEQKKSPDHNQFGKK